MPPQQVTSRSPGNMRRSLSGMKLAFLVLFFVAIAVKQGVGVHITSLSVPVVILNGTEEFIILDCDYTISRPEATGLVVTWYFNGHTVYQWIHNQKPQAVGVLVGKLNLDFKITEDDLTMYRALQINRPTTDLSGEYGCKVSTFEGEAMMKARMIIYAPPKEWGVKTISKPNSEYVNVTCWANEVYPEPKLTIFYGVERGEKTLEDVQVDSEKIDGAYNVRVYKVIESKDLIYPTVFDCELKIPNTSFVSRNHTLYQGPAELRESASSSSSMQILRARTGSSGSMALVILVVGLVLSLH